MEEVNGIQIYKNGEIPELMKQLDIPGKKLVFPYGVRITEENGTVTLRGMTIEEGTALLEKANVPVKGIWQCPTSFGCTVKNGCQCDCSSYVDPTTGDIGCICLCP